MKIPLDAIGKARHYAYVEFGNDEDLQAALNKHEDVSRAIMQPEHHIGLN